MSAAPAIGTARKSASSQNPAWNDLAIAENHGTYAARTSGLKSASEGVHQPSDLVAKKYRATSYAMKAGTSRYPAIVRPATAREPAASRPHTRQNWG